MPKYGKYEKHYNKSWEALPEFAAWLTKNPDPNALNQEAYCTWCKQGLRAHKTDLQTHANTRKHRTVAASFQKQKPLSTFGINVTGDKTKTAELKLAVFTAMHCAVKSIDHLGELVKDLGKKSDLENVRIHRTKCSKLLTNVISPVLLKSLVADIGNSPYSLILDESTDISVQKHLAICVRYFSQKHQQIITDFLGMVTVTDTTAKSLYDHLIFYLKSIDLPITNLIAIGTDGASNMVGRNCSLFTFLRDEVPLSDLILIRCICHSLHLCASKASDTLPSTLEFLLRESRRWFSQSPKRMKEYRQLYNLINDNNKVMLQLIQLSDTRWLAFESAVRRILDQWLELKTHFRMVSTRQDDKCYTAKQLALMYEDSSNHLYLYFLKSILKEVNDVNTTFQSTDKDIHQLYRNLWTLILSVASRILKPTFLEKAKATESIKFIESTLDNELALKAAKDVDFGFEFRRVASTAKLTPGALDDIQARCTQYLLVLCKQLVQRMPNNFQILKSCAQFSVEKVSNITTVPTVTDIPSSFLRNADLTDVDNQLRQIALLNWEDYFTRETLSDSSLFWPQVFGFKNAGGKQVFKDLATVVLNMLSLPISNAVVERVFSVMNYVKTKQRNKMLLKMLEAILRIRIYCHVRKICCSSFEPTREMFELFTAQMYETPKMSSKETAEEINVLDETLRLFNDDASAFECVMGSTF